MKLGMNEIRSGVLHAAIDRTAYQLRREGFTVEPERFFKDAQLDVDLYAYKETEKRIYEFKFGKNKIRQNQLVKLQEFAKQIGARLYVIYLELPQSKEIVFDGIDNILYGHLSENPPEEICELATHFYIESVENVDISSIVVENEIVSMRGNASLIVKLQFGSHSDWRNGDGFEETVEFEFAFRLKLDVANRDILYSYYKFDTSWYYQ